MWRWPRSGRRPGKTIVFVTHSISEAVYLSDTIHVMGTNPGRIVDTVDIDMAASAIRRLRGVRLARGDKAS